MHITKRIQFSIVIAAPVSVVYELMTDAESYKDWTSAFAHGSYYEGSWSAGERIRFLSPTGEGMVAEIAENRPNEFISIKHLGLIVNGVEDTDSDVVRSWAPAFENYSFMPVAAGTKVIVDQDVNEEFESYMVEAWPKALARLKALCESRVA